jgi:hypothetical protein
MTRPDDRSGITPSVAPLRMQYPDGGVYRRFEEVEKAIADLSRLQPNQLVERCRIEAAGELDYVPSECVVYFVRRPHLLNDEDAHRELFMILRERVLRAVPVRPRRLANSRKVAEKSIDLEIQELALHRFHELLCSDRADYERRLDFYEIRFNSAIEALRVTAHRDAKRKVPPGETVPLVDDSNAYLPEMESTLASIRKSAQEGVDFLYRSKLHLAISSLPEDERRVVELLLEEIPIDSQNKDDMTIVKALGCVEKTVRNRRNRAFEKLREALKEDDV